MNGGIPVKKRVISFILMLSVFASMMLSAVSTASAATVSYGLTVSDNGTVLLNGTPYSSLGTNLYSAFHHYYSDPLDQRYIRDFDMMVKYNIDLVRIPFCDYGSRYYKAFDADPDTVIYMMKDVLKAAEERGIGIIVSLMWADPAVSEHVGEKRSAMGNVNSKTVAYAKKYTATLVKALKDSPAVWGWEVGNEYNLTADLFDPNYKNYLPWNNTTGTAEDYYTSHDLHVFYSEIAKEIRKYDSYRLITNGNGGMRESAYNMSQASKNADKNGNKWAIDWTHDTMEQFVEICQYYTPDPMDTLSFHFQNATNGSSNPSYIFTHKFSGKTVDSKTYFKAYVSAMKSVGKAVFFGEFGDMLDMETAPDCMEKFDDLCSWILSSGIQIACTWQFLYAREDGNKGEKMAILSNYNKQLISKGKNKAADYWKAVKAQTPATTTTKTSSVTTKTNVPPMTTTGTNSNTGVISSTQPGASDAGSVVDVSSYMVSCSTKLTIDAANNEILLAQPTTLDVFNRSMVLREGYRLEVADVTDQQAVVPDGTVVTVYDGDTAVRTFTVRIADQVTGDPNVSQGDTVNGEKPDSGWVLWVIVLAVLVLAGAGVVVYFLAVRPKRQKA